MPLLTIAVVSAWLASQPATITGNVVSVSGSEVTIACEGDLAPRVGDPVTIGFESGGELIPVEGDWRITAVDGGQVRASASDGGQPAVGWVARIRSDSPQPRAAPSGGPHARDPGDLFDHDTVPPRPEVDAEEMFRRGQQHKHGRDGVSKDYERAVYWFRQAAQLGHARAQYQVGLAYGGGKGVEKDRVEAFEWYEKAAAQGLAEAQTDVGVYLATGQAGHKDERRAVAITKKAAAQGHALAVSNLGAMYADGIGGLPQDYAQAAAHYRRASEMGEGRATRNLAQLYEKGRGVPRDREKAVELYRQAAREGFKPAKTWLKKHGLTW